MVARGRRVGEWEILVKGYKLCIIREISSVDLMYSIVTLVKD